MGLHRGGVAPNVIFKVLKNTQLVQFFPNSIGVFPGQRRYIKILRGLGVLGTIVNVEKFLRLFLGRSKCLSIALFGLVIPTCEEKIIGPLIYR